MTIVITFAAVIFVYSFVMSMLTDKCASTCDYDSDEYIMWTNWTGWYSGLGLLAMATLIISLSCYVFTGFSNFLSWF